MLSLSLSFVQSKHWMDKIKLFKTVVERQRAFKYICSVLLAFLESTSRRSNRIVTGKDDFCSTKERNQRTQSASALDQWCIRVSSLDRLTARGSVATFVKCAMPNRLRLSGLGLQPPPRQPLGKLIQIDSKFALVGRHSKQWLQLLGLDAIGPRVLFAAQLQMHPCRHVTCTHTYMVHTRSLASAVYMYMRFRNARVA